MLSDDAVITLDNFDKKMRKFETIEKIVISCQRRIYW